MLHIFYLQFLVRNFFKQSDISKSNPNLTIMQIKSYYARPKHARKTDAKPNKMMRMIVSVAL